MVAWFHYVSPCFTCILVPSKWHVDPIQAQLRKQFQLGQGQCIGIFWIFWHVLYKDAFAARSGVLPTACSISEKDARTWSIITMGLASMTFSLKMMKQVLSPTLYSTKSWIRYVSM